ncbi:Protein CBG21126 [Caenorhabditis briggsae]|uniref:Protein CBG21126 n=2 Tax=Caenorhabditis briggsae TaxID=6238 RepID=A8XZF4_CAEBR|nr:Protein CBG21126 [Caenorhabditis briggsae]CAP38081.2 Protein CBG21126 [Caenorhabditis briggsae]
MSRPLLYDLWPTVMDRMDLANRILLSEKCPALRRTDQRCPDEAANVEITTHSVKINNTSFYVKKYHSGEHIEVSMNTFCGHSFKTVFLKTTVPLPEAQKKLRLESLELDYNFSLSKGAPAKTVILIGQAFGIVASNIHRIYVKYCIMDSSNVIDLVKSWQMVKPEIGRHYSLEPQRSDTAIGYFRAAQKFPGARKNFKLASGMFPFGLCFPISRDKMLNVYMEIGKNKDGTDKYVIHFKIDPILLIPLQRCKSPISQMPRPLLYDIWPTVIERMELSNRILMTQRCPALRRTDHRCPAEVHTVEITPDVVKINNTSFYVIEYRSRGHIEIFKDDVNCKTVILKTTVPVDKAREKLFNTLMKGRSGILKVKNLSILGDLNLPPNLRFCVRNFKVAKPDYDPEEDFLEREKRTLTLMVDLQKALTADSFPLESFEYDNSFTLVPNIPAKTAITITEAVGIHDSDMHRIHVKYWEIDWWTVGEIVDSWQNSKPEIGRHYSMEVYYQIDTTIEYFTSDEHDPEVERNFNLPNGTYEYGLIFPIDKEKKLNVLLEQITKENGIEIYVMHFKIDQKS